VTSIVYVRGNSVIKEILEILLNLRTDQEIF
jgi:hypothetical protein